MLKQKQNIAFQTYCMGPIDEAQPRNSLFHQINKL